MLTLTLNEPNSLSVGDTAPPRSESLKSNEVLVRVRHVGLCGTDIHAIHGNQPFFSYPRILGHELGVTVEAIGAGVTSLKLGDTCCVEPYLSSPGDRAFARGKTNCSQSTRCLGVHVDGGMREYIVLPAEKLHRSEILNTSKLALVEPLCIGHHAVERAALIGDEVVAVVGLGPIGLGALQFAKLSGAKVIGVDICPKRIAKALELFPSLDVLQVDPEQGVLEQWSDLGIENPEVVIECTGSKPSMETSILLPGFGGRIVFVGIYNGELTFSNPDFHKRELSIISSRNATARNFKSVIELIENGSVDVGPWITHRCSAEEFPDQFSDWVAPGSEILKGVIEFS